MGFTMAYDNYQLQRSDLLILVITVRKSHPRCLSAWMGIKWKRICKIILCHPDEWSVPYYYRLFFSAFCMDRETLDVHWLVLK